jgi:hypothetical protein
VTPIRRDGDSEEETAKRARHFYAAEQATRRELFAALPAVANDGVGGANSDDEYGDFEVEDLGDTVPNADIDKQTPEDVQAHFAATFQRGIAKLFFAYWNCLRAFTTPRSRITRDDFGESISLPA